MKAYTQNIQQGQQETRGVGGRRKNTAWNRDMRRSGEGRRIGQGTQSKQDGHHRDFYEGNAPAATEAGELCVKLIYPISMKIFLSCG